MTEAEFQKIENLIAEDIPGFFRRVEKLLPQKARNQLKELENEWIRQRNDFEVTSWKERVVEFVRLCLMQEKSAWDIPTQIQKLLLRPSLSEEDKSTLNTLQNEWENAGEKEQIAIQSRVAELTQKYDSRVNPSSNRNDDPNKLYIQLNRERHKSKLRSIHRTLQRKQEPSPWIFLVPGLVDDSPYDASLMLKDEYEKILYEKGNAPILDFSEHKVYLNHAEAEEAFDNIIEAYLQLGYSWTDEDVQQAFDKLKDKHLVFLLDVKSWETSGIENFAKKWHEISRHKAQPVLVFLYFAIEEQKEYNQFQELSGGNNQNIYLFPQLELIFNQDVEDFLKREVKYRRLSFNAMYTIPIEIPREGMRYRKVCEHIQYKYQVNH